MAQDADLAIRRATPADRTVVLATTVDAFAADPLLRWLFPRDDRYGIGAAAFFGVLLDLRLDFGAVWITDDSSAVTTWERPGGLPIEPEERDARWAPVLAEFGRGERRRLRALMGAADAHKPTSPHWYLAVAAVAPRAQGRGVGRRVIAAGTDEADAAGVPTVLDTATPANIAIYRRLGFETVAEFTLPDGPTMWVMQREPRPVR